MKKLIIIASVICSFTSCSSHIHTYLMEERGTRHLISVTEWASYKIGDIVEEGRGLYTVVSIID